MLKQQGVTQDSTPQNHPKSDHFGPILAPFWLRSWRGAANYVSKGWHGGARAVSRGSPRVLAQRVTAFGRVRAIMAWSVAVPKHDIPDYITFRGAPNDGLGGCPHRGAIGHDPFWYPFGSLLARSCQGWWQDGLARVPMWSPDGLRGLAETLATLCLPRRYPK